jgi:pimeloyl-ACP methyl ester carboxylesterase
MHRWYIPADPVPEAPDRVLRRESRYLNHERLDAGLVLCLDGVGGYDWLPRLLRRGLDRGGVKAAIVIYHWSIGPLGLWVADLLLRRRNRRAARALARTIAAYQQWKPGRPVTVIGHSAGGAMAAWVLEALPAGCLVERALLLAPALAPSYNLGPAARGVQGNLYVTHSPLDVALLAVGTTVFGTMDGRHTPSAGLTGFRLPDELGDEDRAAYAKVRQIRCRPAMARDGHFGDHMGCTSTRFSKRVLAPIVLGLSDPGEPLTP